VRILLSALLALSFAVAGVQVLMSAGRDFMRAVAERNEAGYWRHLIAYLGTFALAVPLGVFHRHTEQRLALL
jgi:vitamin B12/bleomycin/antimicrobial peptide transport system ATP-binding/permease protein